MAMVAAGASPDILIRFDALDAIAAWDRFETCLDDVSFAEARARLTAKRSGRHGEGQKASGMQVAIVLARELGSSVIFGDAGRRTVSVPAPRSVPGPR